MRTGRLGRGDAPWPLHEAANASATAMTALAGTAAGSPCCWSRHKRPEYRSP
jgi:hypothetical protein